MRRESRFPGVLRGVLRILAVRVDWGLLLALALALIAAAPFLTRPGLPHQTDAELHVYRAAELGHLLRAGAFYPRWAPDLYLGYGYPIFNYYAPLTYYLANLFDLLPGVGIVGGVKAVFVLGLLVASVGSYLLGRDLFSPAAGVLAAASFTFAPYVVFIDPHARGDLAEHFALCLFPLAFYAFYHLMNGAPSLPKEPAPSSPKDGVGGRGSPGGRGSRRGALLGSVLSLAAIVFSHNLLGLVAAILLLAYWLWLVVLGPGRSRAGWGVVAFVLAAAVIAFFWLPFLLERGDIKLQVVGPGHFDFREHFLSLGDLLAPSRVLDMGATAPRYRLNLGLAQWLLAVPAVGALAWLCTRVVRVRGAARRDDARRDDTRRDDTQRDDTRRDDARRDLDIAATSLVHAGAVRGGFFVLSGLGLIVLMLPISTVIWERVPGMAFLQFPWRLLGPANAMLAICAAAGAAASTALLPAGRWRGPILACLLLGILLLALPVLYPALWPADFGPTAPLDIIAWEQESLAYGTTSTGDFLPVEAALAPVPAMPPLLESYAVTGPVDRINRAVLPQDAKAEIVEQGPLYDRFRVYTPKLFLFRLFLFYFPGWHVYVDGQEAQIEVAGPEGFITFWVQEGEHDVLVRFEDTPPRTAGWVISGVGVAALVVALVLMPAPAKPGAKPGGPSCALESATTVRRDCIWLGGAILLFWVLKSGVIDPRDDWFRYTSPPGQARAAQHELHVNFGDQIELLGYDLPSTRVRGTRVRAGEALPLTLYWRALSPLGTNYQSFVHLAQPLDVVWAQEDHLNPGGRYGGFPTTRWPPDKYVWDVYRIQVPADVPPGRYMLNVGLYSLADGYRLQVLDDTRQVVGDGFVIAEIEVIP